MRCSTYGPSVFKRWIMFNSVGAMGIVVQLSVLWLLAAHFNLGYLLATGLAVEAAVLHNFFWHERWTWADRTANCSNGFLKRFMYFHTANGVISLAGNLVLMQLFVGKLGIMVWVTYGLAVLTGVGSPAGTRKACFKRSKLMLTYEVKWP